MYWKFAPRSCTQARIQAACTTGPARGDLVKDHPGYFVPGYSRSTWVISYKNCVVVVVLYLGTVWANIGYCISNTEYTCDEEYSYLAKSNRG